MKERPIIFNYDMVRAILGGRKTQTRMPLKPQPDKVEIQEGWFESMDPGTHIVGSTSPFPGSRPAQYFCFSDPLVIGMIDQIRPGVNMHPTAAQARRIGKELVRRGHTQYSESELIGICPYGVPGDRLWVRETFWCYNGKEDNFPTFCGFYRATDLERKVPWRPSIHMPRWASRITLEITGVRVERLLEISTPDAQCEGMSSEYPRSEFMNLWDSIYAAQGLGLDANPWVWVIEFKRVQEEGK